MEKQDDKNHFATSVYYQGHLYGFDESILVYLDATTGEEKWKTRGYGKGSLIILGEIGIHRHSGSHPARF